MQETYVICDSCGLRSLPSDEPWPEFWVGLRQEWPRIQRLDLCRVCVAGLPSALIDKLKRPTP